MLHRPHDQRYRLLVYIDNRKIAIQEREEAMQTFVGRMRSPTRGAGRAGTGRTNPNCPLYHSFAYQRRYRSMCEAQ